MSDSIVKALLSERAGYVRRSDSARVAEVDAQLAVFGVQVADEVPKPAKKRPAKKRAADLDG